MIFYISVSIYVAQYKNTYNIDCKASFVYLHNPVRMAVFFFQPLLNDGYTSTLNLKLCTVCKVRCVLLPLVKTILKSHFPLIKYSFVLQMYA